MERLKRIAFRLVFLPGWLVWLISLPSFALVICVLATGLEDSIWAYISYGASAYALIICCFNAPRMIHTARSGFSDHLFVQKTVDSQQGQRFMSDSVYRAEIALYAGLAINLAYTVLKMVSGILFRSLWFGSLAGYYMSSLPEYISAVQTIPQLTNINLFVTRVSVYIQGNGWLVLPPGCGIRVSVLQSDAQPDHAGKRGDCRVTVSRRDSGSGGTEHGGPLGACEELSRAALRRRAAAGLHRAGAGEESPAAAV